MKLLDFIHYNILFELKKWYKMKIYKMHEFNFELHLEFKKKRNELRSWRGSHDPCTILFVHVYY